MLLMNLDLDAHLTPPEAEVVSKITLKLTVYTMVSIQLIQSQTTLILECKINVLIFIQLLTRLC